MDETELLKQKAQTKSAQRRAAQEASCAHKHACDLLLYRKQEGERRSAEKGGGEGGRVKLGVLRKEAVFDGKR